MCLFRSFGVSKKLRSGSLLFMMAFIVVVFTTVLLVAPDVFYDEFEGVYDGLCFVSHLGCVLLFFMLIFDVLLLCGTR